MSLRPSRGILVLIAAATVLRLALAAITDLGLDEAYALAVSRAFQLSWFDHPPLTFWIVGITQALFGPDVAPLVLRLPFIALSAVTTWLLYRLTARHFGDVSALWAAFLFTLAPFFFLSAGSWLVPDGPLCFALVLCALALTNIVLADARDGHWRDWLLAGVALGLALLSKYHAAPFALGALAYFVLHPRLRRWFLRPQPYVAVLLAALLFAPVVVWNAQNGWISFGYQVGRGTGSGSSPEAVARLFLLEAVYLLPTTALLLVAAAVWAALKRTASIGFFLALALPIILVLDIARFWGRESYAHWAMPGWMLLMPVLGAMLASLGQRWRPAAPLVAGISALQFAAVLGAVVLLLSDFRIRDPGMDSFRVEAGSWGGVADGIREAGALDGVGFIVTRRWHDAARIAEATRTSLPVAVFWDDARGFAWTVDQEVLLGQDALFVVRPFEAEQLPQTYAGYFESFEPVGAFPIEAGNPNTINVVRARNLLKPYALPYGP